MNSHLTITPENTLATVTDLFLLRYVKPSYIRGNEPTDEAFQLREDRLPPEEYLSFYQSSASCITQRYKDLINIMKKKNFKLAKNSGVIHLNTEDINSELNVPRKLVEIKACNKPHYGLFFCTDNEDDIIEAKTMLLFLSEFEFTRNIQ